MSRNELRAAMEVAAQKTVPERSSKQSVPKAGSRNGKTQIAAFFPGAVGRQLRILAAEQDTTVQNLMAKALNDLFAAYGKPEIAPVEEGK